MFALECLAEVTGTPTVKFDGIPEWFGQCLGLRMRGEGGDLKTLEWPDKTFRRKNHSRSLSKVSTKVSWQLVFDWQEFAERNGTEMPEDVGRFSPPDRKVAS